MDEILHYFDSMGSHAGLLKWCELNFVTVSLPLASGKGAAQAAADGGPRGLGGAAGRRAGPRGPFEPARPKVKIFGSST